MESEAAATYSTWRSPLTHFGDYSGQNPLTLNWLDGRNTDFHSSTHE